MYCTGLTAKLVRYWTVLLVDICTVGTYWCAPCRLGSHSVSVLVRVEMRRMPPTNSIIRVKVKVTQPVSQYGCCVSLTFSQLICDLCVAISFSQHPPFD